MKKKVEVTIRNEDGEITFYKQQIMDGNGKIQIPMKQILKAQQETVRDTKQPIH